MALDEQPLRLSTHRGLALALLATAQFMVVLDASIMNIALPSVRDDLDASTETLSWVVNAYVLAFGGFLLLGGRSADLLGRRRVFMAGLLLFAIASLAGGLAASTGQLIAARALQGLGAAALAPAALSIVTTLYPEGPERNHALGVWGAVAASGGMAGVLLGGVIVSGLGWEWVLFVNVPIGLAAAVLAPRLFGETRAPSAPRRFDAAGAITVTAGLVLLVLGLVEAPDAGFLSAQTLGLVGGGLALLAAFVAIEARAAAPLVPLTVFRMRGVRAANAAMLAAGAAIFGLFFFISLYMQEVLGFDALEAGLSQLPLAVVLISTSTVAANLIGRLGVRPVLLGGLALFCAGLGWLSFVSADGSFLADVLGPSLVIGAGLSLAFVALTIEGVSGVGERDYGLASGLINTTQQVGGAVGLAILTAIAAERTASAAAPGGVVALNEGYRAALLGAAGFALVGLALASLLTHRRQGPIGGGSPRP